MKILIAVGRTGGHIFPGLSLAEELKKKLMAPEFVFVGTGAKLERQIFSRAGYRLWTIPIDPMPYGISARWGRFLLRLISSLGRSWLILRQTRPDIVVGFGGAISGPILLASALMRIPTLIHEQNVIPGRSNRILCRFVTKVAISFPESRKYFARKDLILTGNPLRPDILHCDRADSLRRLGLVDGKFTVLIVGGSQGSHRINEAVAGVFSNMDEATISGLQVIHLTGEDDYGRLKDRYQSLELNKAIFAFLDQMDKAYAASDLVIARAGATTIAEITSLGLPAILIPYPHANGHQQANAKVLKEVGGAVLIGEDEMTTSLIKDWIVDLMGDVEKLAKMAANSKALGNPDASQRLADEVIRFG